MIRLFGTMMICLALAACGGGGGGGGGDEPTPSSTSPGSGGESAPGTSRPGLGSEAPAPLPPDPPTSEGPSSEGPSSETGSANVDLSWTPPTARENGEPLKLSEILGYEIYFYAEGSDSDEGQTIRIEDNTQTSYAVEVPGPGTYHFAMIAVDTNGLPSDMSNHVSVTVD